jgi:competence protein ComEC
MSFRKFLDDEKNRFALWLPISFACGILLYFNLPMTPPLWLGGCLFLFFVISACIERAIKGRIFISLFILFFAAGFMLISVRSELLYSPVLPKKTKAVEIIGQIDNVDIRGSGQRLLFHNPVIEGMTKDKTPVYARVKVNTLKERYQAGDTVKLKAVLMPPPMPSAPDGYDTPRKFYFQQLGATGFAVSKVTVLQKAKGLKGFISRLRQDINFHFLKVMDKREAGVAMSLITGEQGANSKELADAYRSSGIAHILSVSGLHMSMLAGLVFGFIRLLLAFIPAVSLRYNTKKIAAWTAIFVSFCYLFISGASIPAVRAFIMVLIVLLAVILDRNALSVRSVTLAFFIILCIYPESIVSAGFQMSFAAVFALIAAFESGMSKFNKKLMLVRMAPEKQKVRFRLFKSIITFCCFWIIVTLLTDFTASAATLPFCTYHFDRVAVYSFLTNLIAAPILTVAVMPCLALGTLLIPVWADNLPLMAAEYGIYLINQTAFWVQGLDNSVYVMPKMPNYILAVVTFGGLWLCLWKSKIRFLGLLPIILLFIYPYIYVAPDVLAYQGGKMFAVLTADGKFLIEPGRANQMARENWLSKNGEDYNDYDKEKAKNAWKKGYKDEKVSLECENDKLCYYHSKGKVIAFVKDYDSLKSACDKADVVFSTVNAEAEYCKSPLLIERRQMWQNGSYELKISGKGVISVRSAADGMGKHLWLKKPIY